MEWMTEHCRPPRLYHRSLHKLLSETKMSVVSEAPFARDHSFRIPAASTPNRARPAFRNQILFALCHVLDMFIGSHKDSVARAACGPIPW